MTLLLLACAGPDVPDSSGGATPEDSAATDTGNSDLDTAGDTAEDTGGDTGEPVDPYDLDADGHRALEGGGGDCDDANATVNPDAPEICDPIDHDCDGEALEPGVCGGDQAAATALRPIARMDRDSMSFSRLGLVSDLDGDGRAEAMAGCSYGCDARDGGAVFVFAGGTFPAAPASPLAEVGLTFGRDDGLLYVGLQLPDVGDVDGDGFGDAGVVAHAGSYGVYVHHGPLALAGGERWMAADADEHRWASYGGTSWGFPVADGADYDGDGRDDVAVSLYTESEGADAAVVDVFFGGDAASDHVRLRETYGASVLQPVGDLDLDGLADLVVVHNNLWVYWLSGAELRASSGAMLSDVAAGQFVGNGDIRERPTDDWVSLGDWDGDGYPEIAGGAGSWFDDVRGQGQIYIFGGDLRGEVPIEEAKGSFIDSGELDGLGVALESADLDGDGTKDLLAESWVWYVIPGGDGIPALRSPIPERSLAFADMGAVSAGHDYTGDGIDDLLSAVEDGTLGIYAGWPIPWDESGWW